MPPLGFGQVETMSARVLDIRALSEELPLHSSDDRTADESRAVREGKYIPVDVR